MEYPGHSQRTAQLPGQPPRPTDLGAGQLQMREKGRTGEVRLAAPGGCVSTVWKEPVRSCRGWFVQR